MSEFLFKEQVNKNTVLYQALKDQRSPISDTLFAAEI